MAARRQCCLKASKFENSFLFLLIVTYFSVKAVYRKLQPWDIILNSHTPINSLCTIISLLINSYLLSQSFSFCPFLRRFSFFAGKILSSGSVSLIAINSQWQFPHSNPHPKQTQTVLDVDVIVAVVAYGFRYSTLQLIQSPFVNPQSFCVFY